MSNNLNLSQVTAAQNQKEVTINDQAAELDAAITEQFEADVSAGNVALTATQYRRAVHIKAIGAATAGRTVTLQAIKKLSIISNWSTTDSVDVVLGTATVTLAPAEDVANPTMALVYTDGTANGLFAVSSGIGGGIGAFTDLTDTPSDYSGHGGKLIRVNPGATALEFVAQLAPYDFGFAYPGGPPEADEVMSMVVIPRAITLPADFAGAAGHIDTLPTASFAISVTDDEVEIGTMTIDDAGAFTFATSGGTAKSIAAGSVVRFVAPTTPDATAASMAATLIGTLA